MPESRPVLDQLNLVVRDMEVSVAFYRTLGVQIDDGDDEEWAQHHRTTASDGSVDVDLDSAAFASQWNEGWPNARAGIVTGFRVATRDEVDRIYRALTDAGHPGQQPPYDAFWGARYAIVEDPDGNVIGIMSPSDPDRRTRRHPRRAADGSSRTHPTSRRRTERYGHESFVVASTHARSRPLESGAHALRARRGRPDLVCPVPGGRRSSEVL